MGALHARRVRRLLPLAFCSLGAIGASDLGAVAAAQHFRDPPAAGWLIASLSAGSILGGLWWGARDHRGSVGLQGGVLCGVMGLGFALVSVLPGLAAMGIALAGTGLSLAPLLTVQSTLMANSAPAGYRAEALSWLNAMGGAGAASATAIAGPLISTFGANSPFLLASVLAVVAAILSLTTLV